MIKIQDIINAMTDEEIKIALIKRNEYKIKRIKNDNNNKEDESRP
tara:strand:+ start:273 stop:407 length:135 start_codon:yes stop_codon:yes gene_type:complete